MFYIKIIIRVLRVTIIFLYIFHIKLAIYILLRKKYIMYSSSVILEIINTLKRDII